MKCFNEKLSVNSLNIFFKNKQKTFFEKNNTNNLALIQIQHNLYRFLYLFKFFLYQNLPYLLDIFVTKFTGYYVKLFYIFSFFISDFRVIISSNFQKTTKQDSITSLWAGSSWAERESSEFSGVVFNNLNDSRRLLTDYTHLKEFPETHNKLVTFYSSFYSDIIL